MHQVQCLAFSVQFFEEFQDKFSKMSDVVFISQRREMNLRMAYYIPKSLSNRKREDPNNSGPIPGIVRSSCKYCLGRRPSIMCFWSSWTQAFGKDFSDTLLPYCFIYYLFLAFRPLCVSSVSVPESLSSKWCRMLFASTPALFYGRCLLEMTSVKQEP